MLNIYIINICASSFIEDKTDLIYNSEQYQFMLKIIGKESVSIYLDKHIVDSRYNPGSYEYTTLLHYDEYLDSNDKCIAYYSKQNNGIHYISKDTLRRIASNDIKNEVAWKYILLGIDEFEQAAIKKKYINY